jgi:hypothetical protein
MRGATRCRATQWYVFHASIERACDNSDIQSTQCTSATFNVVACDVASEDATSARSVQARHVARSLARTVHHYAKEAASFSLESCVGNVKGCVGVMDLSSSSASRHCLMRHRDTPGAFGMKTRSASCSHCRAEGGATCLVSAKPLLHFAAPPTLLVRTDKSFRARSRQLNDVEAPCNGRTATVRSARRRSSSVRCSSAARHAS